MSDASVPAPATATAVEKLSKQVAESWLAKEEAEIEARAKAIDQAIRGNPHTAMAVAFIFGVVSTLAVLVAAAHFLHV